MIVDLQHLRARVDRVGDARPRNIRKLWCAIILDRQLCLVALDRRRLRNLRIEQCSSISLYAYIFIITLIIYILYIVIYILQNFGLLCRQNILKQLNITEFVYRKVLSKLTENLENC